jgi:predicted ATP-dependent serine protease
MYYRITLGLIVILLWSSLAAAANVVELPVLSMVGINGQGAVRVMVMSWDGLASPDPMEVKWRNNRVQVQATGMESLRRALRYALSRSPAPHTGTLTIYNASYAPISADGPSSGAAMAVGFLAVLRGDRIQRGIALTGTIEPDGRIGPVGGIPDKIRAAKRENLSTVLVPRGQQRTAQWNLAELALELNITIKEVDTVEEAYELMTGSRL